MKAPIIVRSQRSRDRLGIRVKVTPWRLINTIFLSAAGIWKLICVYRGDPTANALDFAAGAVWALMCGFQLFSIMYLVSFHFSSYWLSLIETEAPNSLPLLFKHDIGHATFVLSIRLGRVIIVSLACFTTAKCKSMQDTCNDYTESN